MPNSYNHRSGIIQYLTNENVKWDNVLMKVLCVFLMFSAVVAVKEARRSSRVRTRRKSEWVLDEGDEFPERTTTKRIDENTYLRLFGGPEGRLDTITLN